jgi:dipeptidyl aminopeptidase/acylaminoacyl peptidase
MHISPARLILSALGTLILAVSSCGDASTVAPVEESGSITVAVQTSAATTEAALDPDGYALFIAGLGSRVVESNGEVTLTDVPSGEHEVRLQGLQVNCTTPDNPAQAAVVAGGTARVAFQVTCWPPTTGRIAFNSNRDGLTQVYTMNANGSDVVRLTALLDGGFWPAWSPDGWRIAFTGGSRVYVINADGTGLTEVASGARPVEVASWSPDGERIAFARYSTGAWGPEDIYLVDADGGGNEVRLTSDPARDFLPAWSPDGSKIAFVSERDGNAEVYVMNADGSDPVNLTNHPAPDAVWPGSWSPDGTRILFGSGRAGAGGEISVMNADGSDPVVLTQTPFAERWASWSQDGTKVVFSQHPVGNIFVMNTDGTGMVDITNSGDVLDRYPHWSWGSGALTSRPQRALSPSPPKGR